MDKIPHASRLKAYSQNVEAALVQEINNFFRPRLIDALTQALNGEKAVNDIHTHINMDEQIIFVVVPTRLQTASEAKFSELFSMFRSNGYHISLAYGWAGDNKFVEKVIVGW